MNQHLLKQIGQVHQTMHAMANQLSDDDYRRQYHQDLSPLGWHVGHCVFIETYWLREVVLNDNTITSKLEWLYIPENILKPERGPALPPIEEHLQWCKQLADENSVIFQQASPALTAHKLNKQDYLLKFILQHHSQHIETMAMVLAQRQLQLKPTISVSQPLKENTKISYHFKNYAGGIFNIGSPHEAEAFDNELPPQQIELNPFLLADSPVTNADWLAFIEDGGYQQRIFWDDPGWEWCKSNNISRPETWLANRDGDFCEISSMGAKNLKPAGAVSGVNYFEANAYIAWLRHTSSQYKLIRLPHEHEWEVADKSGTLKRTGEVWEWCENLFYPYDGFKAFPYENYSKPWFDNNHFCLRGGSQHTQDIIRRSSFRNFYNPDKRHIFSGLRLAMPTN